MKRAWLRSTLFNILFFLWSCLCCIVYLPVFLLPRDIFLRLIKIYLHGVTILEKIILNLHYEVRGRENIPQNGSYIVAAKHQSPYETLKLHLLFDDPAVILKQELLKIPLWGRYLKKADVIAIDRSSPDSAIQSIQEGAKRVQKQNRPIIIFPQGTRVHPHQTAQEKPYKVGIARIQEATNLPIIPLALNTGLFWPRSGWGKSPGKITFEFLEPIPSGMKRSDLVSHIEKTIETKSNALNDQARQQNELRKVSRLKRLARFLIITLLCYTALWFGTAHMIKEQYLEPLKNHPIMTRTASSIAINGYPGPLRINIPTEHLRSLTGHIKIKNIQINAWPIPFMPINIKTGEIELKDKKWQEALIFDNGMAHLLYTGRKIKIYHSHFTQKQFEAQIKGRINFQETSPTIQATLNMNNHESIIETLKTKNILSDRMALWANAGLSAFKNEDHVEIPIQTRQEHLYIGPLKVMKLVHNTSETPLKRKALQPSPQ